nr:RNA polymerase I-specific transcription initiation factor RRN3-like [Tanacetum cinerariifolium]
MRIPLLYRGEYSQWVESNKTAKDLWDALARDMLGSEYGEQDRKAADLYESKEKVVVSLDSEESEADDFSELKRITALFVIFFDLFEDRKFSRALGLATPQLKSQMCERPLEQIFKHALNPLGVCLPSIVEKFLCQCKVAHLFHVSSIYSDASANIVDVHGVNEEHTIFIRKAILLSSAWWWKQNSKISGSKRKRFDFLADFVPEKVKAEDALKGVPTDQ